MKGSDVSLLCNFRLTVSEMTESNCQDFHIWPDFHGNRSPLADPSLKGVMMGLTLATDLEDLAVQYLAAIQAVAYGVKHIVDTLQAHGHEIKVRETNCVS